MQQSAKFLAIGLTIIFLSGFTFALDRDLSYPVYKGIATEMAPTVHTANPNYRPDYQPAAASPGGVKTYAASQTAPYPCCDTPGDANNDGGCNIGDAVFLVNLVFKEDQCATNPPIGCAPECFTEGDANNDGGINIGDAVYIGNIVFRPGVYPDPNCIIDFAVIGDRTGQFNVMVDRTSDRVTGVYPQILSDIADHGADFAVTVGDQIEGYTFEGDIVHNQWDEYLDMLAPYTATMNINLTPGNHDISWWFQDVMEPIYEMRVGPRYHSFDVGCAHFIVLDNSRWGYGTEFVDPEGDNVDQYNWLVADLASVNNTEACHTFVFMHIPFWYYEWDDLTNDPLHSLFRDNGVDAVFTGHFHWYAADEYEGVKYMSVVCSGGIARTAPCGLLFGYTQVVYDLDNFTISSIRGENEWDYGIKDKEYSGYLADMYYSSTYFGNAVELVNENTVEETQIIVNVENLLPPEAGTDFRLKWLYNSDSWTFDRDMEDFVLSSGQTAQKSFTLSCNGDPYPPPQCSLYYPLHEGCPTPLALPLPVARTISCPNISGLYIFFDGRVEPGEWGYNPPVLFDIATGARVEPGSAEGTGIFFAWDNDYLYFAARCNEPVMSSVQIHDWVISDEDGFDQEDWIGLSLWTGPTYDELWDVKIDAKGDFDDSRYSMYGVNYSFSDRGYDIEGMEIAYYFELPDGGGEDFWSMEVRIPWSGINMSTPNPGDELGINFGRHKPYWGGDYTDWRYYGHDLETFIVPWLISPTFMGTLVLE